MENKIEPSLENISGYIKYTIQIREKLTDNYLKEMNQIFQYIQSLMGTLGIIAGFGFTAFQFIESKCLFFIGEFLVVGSIVFLIYKLKIYVAGQPMNTEQQINNYSEEARKVKGAILNNDELELKNFVDGFSKKVNDVSIILPLKMAKIINESLEKAFLCSVFGIILIFLSFWHF
ncbi:MAG: hypothetical protein WCK60_00360 [Candidatus Nomurabacteria bacterium]